MKRVFPILVVVLLTCALVSCGSQASSNPGADITGKWNAVFTVNGQSTPTYTVGISFSKISTTITGSEIAYTGGGVAPSSCVNYGNWTATGNTNGGSVITLAISDPSTQSTFTVSASADATVTTINGTFSANYKPNGSQPACTDDAGSIVFTRQ
jgi:hypothetical protein